MAGALRFPANAILIYGTSLCIVAPFIPAMLAFHHLTPPGTQVWTHASRIFTIIRAVVVREHSVVHLATVIPARRSGASHAVRVLEPTPHSVCWEHDAVGHAAMGLACLLAVAAVKRVGFERWAGRSLIANALVTPFISIKYFHPRSSTTGLFLGCPWAITAPRFMLMLAIMRRRTQIVSTPAVQQPVAADGGARRR